MKAAKTILRYAVERHWMSGHPPRQAEMMEMGVKQFSHDSLTNLAPGAVKPENWSPVVTVLVFTMLVCLVMHCPSYWAGWGVIGHLTTTNIETKIACSAKWKCLD